MCKKIEMLKRFLCVIERAVGRCRTKLKQTITNSGLGAKASEKLPKIVRTIADLSAYVENIPEHTAETKWYPKYPADRTLDAQLSLEV